MGCLKLHIESEPKLRLIPSKKGQKPLKKTGSYYPFGLKQKGYNNDVIGGNDLAQNWKFGGKEYNQELGLNWYDVTARNYDPAIGRWMNLDPLAEDMRRHSPYNYAFDNPIYFIDYDGMAPEGSCCGFPPINPISILVGIYNAGKKLLNMDSINVEGSDSGSNNQGGYVLSNDDGGATGDQSLIRPVNSESGDVEWLEVGDAVSAGTGMAGAGMKGPSGKKGKVNTGDGKTNAKSKTSNTASKVNKNVKAFKNGMKDGKKVTNGAGSIENSNDSASTDNTEYSINIWKDGVGQGGAGAYGEDNANATKEKALDGSLFPEVEIDSVSVEKVKI